MRIVILGSGRGTNAEAILQAQNKGELGRAKVVGILSDNENAGILEVGKRFGIESCYIHPGKYKTKLEGDAENEYIERIESWNADVVVLAGFMRVIKPNFLDTFPKILNIHPSLLPAFPGLNGIQQAFDYGVKATGCTVHWVSEDIDAGHILGQEVVRIEKTDTLEALEEKVHAAEHALYLKVIKKLSHEHS